MQESNVAFVDMRGSLGDMVCTKGDVNYDLSKVYQSLCGYDFIIMDKELDATAMDILHDLKEVITPIYCDRLCAVRYRDCQHIVVRIRDWDRGYVPYDISREGCSSNCILDLVVAEVDVLT